MTKLSEWSVDKILFALIFLVILINAAGFLLPCLMHTDSYWYAEVTKHISDKGDWVNLFYKGEDWLDKPHFPFWVTAVFFKIFGAGARTYVLPGFLFNLLGAYFTFKIGEKLYGKTTGLVAALVYLSTLHLVVSAIDVRAEAFLLGEIMAAIYFWLEFDEKGNWKNLFAGSFFTGIAMMTKGPFVVITIFSGLVIKFIYERRYWEVFRAKWLIGYLLSLIFVLPELICLYLQFDAHPEKVIFGRTGVSGIGWFFWGSQFGRFLETGPIVKDDGSVFFYLHTFLWSFLPWTIFFILAVYNGIKTFRLESLANRRALVFLQGCFWPTFILFSLSKFQWDWYINILLPFAALASADYLRRNFLGDRAIATTGRKITVNIQMFINYALLAVASVLMILVYGLSPAGVILAAIPLLLIIITIVRRKKIPDWQRVIVLPAVAMLLVFGSYIGFFLHVNVPQDLGLTVSRLLHNQPQYPIFVSGEDSKKLQLYFDVPTRDLVKMPSAFPFYLLTNADDKNRLNEQLKGYEYQVMGQASTFTCLIVSKAIFEPGSITSKFELVRIDKKK